MKVFDRENLKPVGDFLKKSWKVIVPILGVALSSVSGADILHMYRYSGEVGYDDAVEAIMDASMMGSDKAKLMQILKRDENSEYYKAIISTVKSSMMGSTKIEIIRNLSKSE